jgi:hypothetical protein
LDQKGWIETMVAQSVADIKSRKIMWAGHVALTGEMRKAYRIWVGKPERRRPVGRYRHG